MRPGLRSRVLAIAAIAATGARADDFRLKVLSDRVADLTDLPSFCESATARWATNDEKAAAIAHWFAVLGHQAPSPHDSFPTEPILFFNNFSNGYCAHWTALYGAVAEGGMGWVGRHYEIPYHTVPELEYDGTRHYLDNTHKFYPLACDGRRILALDEMDDVAECARGGPAPYHSLCFHTRQAFCPDLDGYEPAPGDSHGRDATRIRAWLTGSWLPRDAASRGAVAGAIDEAWMAAHWMEWYTEGFHSTCRYILDLRDGESYTRYFDPLGTTTDYYWPTAGGRDSDAAERYRGRGNGRWVFVPSLESDASFESLAGAVRVGTGLRPASAGQEAVAVFKVQPANLVTGSIIEAEVFRNDEDDSIAIEVSGNAGRTWTAVWADEGIGALSIRANASDALKGRYPDTLRMVFDHFVRVRMTARGDASHARLDAIRITTITVCNRMALPKLGLGRNEILVDWDASRQIETTSLSPLLKKDLYRLDAVDGRNVASGESQDSFCVLHPAVPDEEGHVTFQLDAPRPIVAARMGGALWIGLSDPARNYVRFECRFSGGEWSDWRTVARYDWTTRDNNHRRCNQSKVAEIPLPREDVRSIQFRFVFRAASLSKYLSAGASRLRMEIEYQAADDRFEPLEVAYGWTEFREPLPQDESGGVARTHVERIDALPHRYAIHTGGDIPPRTDWIRVNLLGSAPDPLPAGYSDGVDAGDRDEIPPHRYIEGSLLSFGKPYAVSTRPANDTFRAPGDEMEMTDGYVRFPQAEGPWPDTGLARWPAGPEVIDITVDLGGAARIGGARVDAFCHPFRDEFPRSVEVSTSTDGATFIARGTDRHRGARYAHNDWPADWPLYPRHDATLYGLFPNFGMRTNPIFVLFEAPAMARYVRFRIRPRPGEALILSEVHVWDSLRLEPWTPRLAHEGTGDADGDGMADDWEILFIGTSSEGAAGDHDGDGLANGEEEARGTRPDARDSDGDGSTDGQEVLSGTDPLDPLAHLPLPAFVRGDGNGDGSLDIGDVVDLLAGLFAGGEPPECAKAGDVDDDGALSLADAVGILDCIFVMGPPPGWPFPECGADPTPDLLDCESYPRCGMGSAR